MMAMKTKVMSNAQIVVAPELALEADFGGLGGFRLLGWGVLALLVVVLPRVRYEPDRDKINLGGRGGFRPLCLSSGRGKFNVSGP